MTPAIVTHTWGIGVNFGWTELFAKLGVLLLLAGLTALSIWLNRYR